MATQAAPAAAAAAVSLGVEEDVALAEEDVQRAQQLAGALLRQRQQRRQAQQEKLHPHPSPDHSAPPLCTPTQSSPSSSSMGKAVANSLGKSAYIVHLAHQDHTKPLRTSELLQRASTRWGSFDSATRARWVQLTPQGSTLLRQLQRAEAQEVAQAAGEAPRWARSLSSTTTQPPATDTPNRIRLAEQRYAALVKPRLPRPDALVPRRRVRRLRPAPPPPRQHFLRHFFHSDVVPLRDVCFGPTGGHQVPNPNTAMVRDKVTVALHKQQWAQWRRLAKSMLGGEGANVFIGDLKELREHHHTPTAEESHSSPSALNNTIGESPEAWVAANLPEGGEAAEATSPPSPPAYSEAFLDLCDDLRVHSPRKVFVMRHLRPRLEQTTLSLEDVRSVAESLCKDFDVYEAQARQRDAEKASSPECTHGEDGAVKGGSQTSSYAEALVEDELARVHAKLGNFHDELPRVKRLVDVLSK